MYSDEKKLNVAIIDSNSDRRHKLWETFESAGANVVCFTWSGEKYINLEGVRDIGEHRYDMTSEKLDICLEMFNLCLWHAGDYKLKPLQYKETTTVIFYGGDGGWDNRIPKAAERIWKPLLGDNTQLTAKEVGDIIDYAAKIAAGFDVERPTILEQNRSRSCLTALGILCQGYLATWAEAHRVQKFPAVIHHALDLMGWYSMSADARRSLDPNLCQRFTAEPGGVLSLAWWDVFDLRTDESQRINEQRFQDLQIQLQFELSSSNLPTSLDTLLNQLKEGVVKDAENVARAWLDLREHQMA